MTLPDKPLMTAAEVARFFGWSRSATYRNLKSLPTVWLGGRVYVSTQQLRDFVCGGR